MVIIEKYSKDISADGLIFIRADEPCDCPICGGKLRVRDSKKRRVINQSGDKEFYRLRRLKCKDCGTMHTEIPDCIVPYKHYAAEVIEAELLALRGDCPADNITSWRWKSVFSALLVYMNQGLNHFKRHWISRIYRFFSLQKHDTHPLCISIQKNKCYNST